MNLIRDSRNEVKNYVPVRGCLLYPEKEPERPAGLHPVGGIPGIYLAIGKQEFFNISAGTEIKFPEIYPEDVGAEGRFKIIHEIFLVGNRAPAGRRDIRLRGD